MSILTKAQIKHIQSFAHKKYRDEQNSFVAEGLKICSDILKNGGEPIIVYCTASYGLPNECIIDKHEMQKISMLTTASDVLIVFKKKQNLTLDFSNKISLILDGIQDPGNMGTIIRTADWYGIRHIICSNDSADAFAHKVIQATMGSIINVAIIRCDLEFFLSENSNINAYATMLDGELLQQIPKPKQAFIIVGKEGEGIRPAIQALCTNKITIAGNGNAESLNVAVATGIICNHFMSK